MLQEAQGKGDIVPLALRVAPRQASRKLVGELLGVFVLTSIVSTFAQCMRDGRVGN